MKDMSNNIPPKPYDERYYFDSFDDGQVLENKKTGRLPAMGWNSWNAFGSNNTEELTKAMADCIVELGLDKLGYSYVVLDDGCYCPERVNGKLKNEPVKFPSDFKVLADYIHAKNLKFGMYNDIGTNLCAGAAVGTCGHEEDDARSYIDWTVDFLKVDNCYYPWDNATFSNAENAQYVYTPIISKVTLRKDDFEKEYAVKETLGVGTYDGTGPEQTPIGKQSDEIHIKVNVPYQGEYNLTYDFKAAKEIGCGSFIQIKVDGDKIPVYDDFASDTPVIIKLNKGENLIRIMNHRRQENTLLSYAKLLRCLNEVKRDHDILLSICEWGKTQPQNWGYKVGDSWRILNDITFQVGNDGDPGVGAWESDYTTSITAQYNKAVIMDEFSGLTKGYNDPDMLMIGMNGLTTTMCRTHMAMWCMMNSPLMLGLDLRRISKGDELWNIIANKMLIDFNQDPLGIQAKRVKVYLKDRVIENGEPEYIRDNNRVDILAKPLFDGSIAISFINLSKDEAGGNYSISMSKIAAILGKKADLSKLTEAGSYKIFDVWSGEESINNTGIFEVNGLKGCDNVTIKVSKNDSF